MPADGRFRDYYWRLRAFLAEKAAILDEAHEEHRFPEDDNGAYYLHYLEGCLVFVDGSRLVFELELALGAIYDVVERTYYYGYYDQARTRVLQYDNAPHHPHLTTHPHHIHKGARPVKGKDRAFDADLPEVNFITVVSKIEGAYLSKRLWQNVLVEAATDRGGFGPRTPERGERRERE